VTTEKFLKAGRERQNRWRERRKSQGEKILTITLSKKAKKILKKEQDKTGDTLSNIIDRALTGKKEPSVNDVLALKSEDILSNEKSKEKTGAVGKMGDERPGLARMDEKWLLFMESATDSFVLMDSKLNLSEVNETTLALLYPAGTKKEDILGKNLLELVPDTKKRGEYQKFLEILKTGTPMVIEEVTFPAMYGDNRFKYKAFKVGSGLGMIISDITDRKKKEEALQKRGIELKAKTRSLEETNTAMKVLLKRREDDRKELEEKIMFNVKELVDPYIEKMKNSKLGDDQKTYMDILESNLNDIVAPFARGLSKKHLGLTYTELQIANLIKHGKISKEIIDLLNLSLNTIKSYRKSIRKKLGIQNKKINLRTYLTSIK